MKILSAMERNYSTTYIVELTSVELSALSILSDYSEIPVSREDKEMRIDVKKLQPGDVIPPDEIRKRQDIAVEFLRNRDSLESLMAQVKGAMTKLSNTLPK